MPRNYIPYLFIFSLAHFYACDLKNNIEPRYDKTFIRIYGGEYQDEAVDFIALDTGGFAILGSTKPPVIRDNTQDIIFILTDPQGDIYVQKTYGDSLVNETAVKLIQIPGYFLMFSNRANEAFVHKITPDGTLVDSASYKDYFLSDMVLSFDQSIIGVTGQTIVPAGDTSKMVKNYIDVNTLIMTGIPIEPGQGYKIVRYRSDSVFYKILRSKPSIKRNIEFDVIDLFTPDKIHYGTNPPDGIADSAIVPIDTWGDPNTLNWYFIGYKQPNLDNPDPPDGPVLIRLRDTYNTDSRVFEGVEEIRVILDDELYRNIMPSDFIRSPSGGFLLFGTELNVLGEPTITLIKLTNEFLVENRKSYGTGYPDDKAVKIEILPDGSVVFLATVSYRAADQTKIVLYKLTPDLYLDY